MKEIKVMKIVAKGLDGADFDKALRALKKAGIAIDDIGVFVDLRNRHDVEAIGTEEQIDVAEQLLIEEFIDVTVEEAGL